MATVTVTKQYSTASGPAIGSAWWLNLIEGLALLIFGILLVTSPVQTFLAALGFVGLLAFVAGAVQIVAGLVMMFEGFGVGLLSVITGLLGALLGVLVFKNPALSAYVFIILTAVWLIIRGLVSMFSGGSNLGLKVFAGILYLILGISMFYNPVARGTMFVWVWGLFALIEGSIQVALAIRERSYYKAFAP